MRANPYHNIPVLTWCYCAWPGGKIWGGGAAKGGFGWSCRCPWVLPGLTCSYTPSYLPVGGSWSQWTPTQCWCRWQWWWWRCPDMDQGGLNLISVPSKKAAGGKRQFLSKFLSRVSVQSLDGRCRRPSCIWFELQKKRSDVFILYWQCGSLCGKRGGDSHVALRYLFTLTRTQPNSCLILCSALPPHSRKHDTQSEPPLLPLSNPNFFLHYLRFTQICLICQISILAHFQIGLIISYKLTISLPISSDLCHTSICSETLRKTWDFWRQSVKPFFLLELTLAEKKQVRTCFTICLRSSHPPT